MQIKVKETKQHLVQSIKTIDGKYPHTGADKIQVAEAKLVLVECKPEQGLIYIPNWKYEEGNLRLLTKDVSLADAVYKAFKPILISETEKIEVGDYGYSKLHKLVSETSTLWAQMEGLNKVVALPEHFSPEQLQMIVDGKLKDGDKVLVECVQKGDYDIYLGHGDKDARIKLNFSNHITLHKVEDENNPYNLQIGKTYWFQYTGCKSDWFHGIVTRFTKFGHPWVEASPGYSHNGIISPGLYNVREFEPIKEKMYTKEDIKHFLNKYWHHLQYADNKLMALEWFEQNVK